MSAPLEVWAGDLAELRPKQDEATFHVTCTGVAHAVVYWYELTLPGGVTLDSSRLASLGRGVVSLDPMQVLARTPARLIAYRSDSQLGFWPLSDVPSLPRAYRLPRWYPDMLVDQTRNEAYRAAIARVCKGQRVLDAGSGTGLLSKMALEAGAMKVLGCELDEELVEISRRDLGHDVKVSERPERNRGWFWWVHPRRTTSEEDELVQAGLQQGRAGAGPGGAPEGGGPRALRLVPAGGRGPAPAGALPRQVITTLT